MTSRRNRGGGSFRDIRDRHLPIFEWQIGRQDQTEQTAPPKAIRRVWKREGIVHYAVDDSD